MAALLFGKSLAINCYSCSYYRTESANAIEMGDRMCQFGGTYLKPCPDGISYCSVCYLIPNIFLFKNCFFEVHVKHYTSVFVYFK